MTSEIQPIAMPGWYVDPEAPDLLRWWDGTAWSDTEFRGMPAEPSARADTGSGNTMARRAQILFFWALGVGVVFWILPIGLTLVPSPELQTIGVLLMWVGFLPVVVLSILAIVFGFIGLGRVRALGGRRSALTGLIGGGCVLAGPPILAVGALVTAVIVNALRSI
ncbi:hypothetical protein JOE59_002054 [Agromyces cerinus]|uniref:DUF2510 domain-containing protein n=1 Tax=Agromyces cerinus TaxID=33878 RepID=UPI001959639A|nr:DUF2510 domain-containing protein [Agromyces cerinus]MBM7831349.1 hypothetical protein [Agromyces cerinus]